MSTFHIDQSPQPTLVFACSKWFLSWISSKPQFHRQAILHAKKSPRRLQGWRNARPTHQERKAMKLEAILFWVVPAWFYSLRCIWGSPPLVEFSKTNLHLAYLWRLVLHNDIQRNASANLTSSRTLVLGCLCFWKKLCTCHQYKLVLVFSLLPISSLV